MASGKSFPIFAIVLLFISNVSMAVMCARLKSVSAGEYHTLALMEDKTLWACGSNYYWQLGPEERKFLWKKEFIYSIIPLLRIVVIAFEEGGVL
jgi:alpha-tubulin suppressor-like RCC1 family protein